MKLTAAVAALFFAVFGLSLLFANSALAESPETFGLQVQKTLPGSQNYMFKRLKEKVTEFFKFSYHAKFVYRQDLLEKRLSELVSLIDIKNDNEIANATQRFAYEAGVLAEKSQGDKDIINPIFTKYKPILAKMRDNFPANSPFWLLIQQDIDTLNILSAKLK